VSERDLPVRRGLAIPEGELRESASRSGGPGGQHVNKVSTRVTLRWNALESAVLTPAQLRRLRRRLGARLTRSGELVVHARRHRSRARNRELARERLAELVRQALASPKPRVPTRPSRAARERTLAVKRRRSHVKRSRRPVRDEE
jgi:ribosome-associated protein